MRIHYGPGYRIYFKEFRQVAVILWAGDKDTQTADIQKAKDILAGLEE